MVNKLVIVLALLITLSMATKLEFKSEKCEFGTWQERMVNSNRIYESIIYDDDLNGSNEIKVSFIKKIAQMAATNASYDERLDTLKIYNKFIPTDTYTHVRENRYFEARESIAKNMIADFEPYSRHLFAYNYIKNLLKKKDPDSCLTLIEFSQLYA
jgi:hypothetical protein